MTRLAFSRIIARNVIRVCCAVEICEMAAHTCGGQTLILIVDVTLIARRCLMRAKQWETRIAVIECCRPPCSLCVTSLALRREITRGVVRVRHSSVVCTMAGNAIRGFPGKDIVTVATSALLRLVRANQREKRLRVVEPRTLPRCCRVTRLALSRKLRGSMTWVRC